MRISCSITLQSAHEFFGISLSLYLSLNYLSLPFIPSQWLWLPGWGDRRPNYLTLWLTPPAGPGMVICAHKDGREREGGTAVAKRLRIASVHCQSRLQSEQLTLMGRRRNEPWTLPQPSALIDHLQFSQRCANFFVCLFLGEWRVTNNFAWQHTTSDAFLFFLRRMIDISNVT